MDDKNYLVDIVILIELIIYMFESLVQKDLRKPKNSLF